ncbi:hypothetical protein B0H14DRAFT_3107448 [Mycena olivaceomarginata]|nr:hypothetical protein B0H14DRAFT_3107448 [Mycena olivaceomarginata]
MRLLSLSLGLSCLKYVATTVQIPLKTAFAETDAISASDSKWTDLTARPNANGTSQFVFDNGNAMLQHWTHTRYRNGHSIIPATVPVGTLLYHGRGDTELPTHPEWTAIDPEHSFPFCGAWNGNDTSNMCWQLTLVATRPKVDLLVWGKVDPERRRDEWGRINALCAWGRDFGIDGYVRMEMSFEIMLCDFSQGVELASADNLATWWTNRTTPPFWRPPLESHPPPRSSAESLYFLDDDDPFFPAGDIFRFEIARADSWHNHYPSETRIELDLTGFISFYDTALAPSLVSARQGTVRWDRLAGVSLADLEAVKSRLGDVLTRGPHNVGSGVDWRTLYRVVLERYAERLELLDYLLDTTTPHNANMRARQIQAQLRVMLTPYILYTSRPLPRASVDLAATGNDPWPWALPVWHGCAMRHTAHIHANASLQSRLTPSERLLLRALDETNREICRVVVRIRVAGVHAGLDTLIPLEDTQITTDPLLVVEAWRPEAAALMKWLDWGVWTKCRPACAIEEICYLPTWPYFWGGLNRPDPTDDRWKRPQPRCFRQIAPYSGL